jgi:hypothetical protein
MQNVSFLFVAFLFFACQATEERCGTIIQKVEIENRFYFVLQTDEYINYYNTPSQPNLPDDGVRQGIVSKEIYDNFEEGDEYCSE